LVHAAVKLAPVTCRRPGEFALIGGGARSVTE